MKLSFLTKEQLQSDRVLIPIAFLCIYFIWGSTYLATDWAFEAFPPFFMTAIRLLTAGAILFVWSRKHWKTTSKKQVRNASFFGFLLLSVGTGASMWSVLYLDTGMASLMIGCEPLVLVIFTWILLKQAPSYQKMLGVFIGMFGMYILVSQETISTSPEAYKGIIAVWVSIFSWTIGAIYLKHSDLPKSQVMNTAIQMICGGLVLLLVSLLSKEDIAGIAITFTWEAFFCLLYLTFFGSIIAYTAFNFLLVKEDPRKVATVTYVNPIIAMILGWQFNEEIISQQSILAAIILISGVVFIIRD